MNRHLPNAEQKRLGRLRTGEMIRVARERKGLSVKEVEQACDMGPTRMGESYLTAVEAGRMELLDRFRPALCELLGIDEATLPRFRAGQRDTRRDEG